MEFIDITQTSLRDTVHNSALQIDEHGPKSLYVVGVIPHMTRIVPKTQADADKLRAWLDKHYPATDTPAQALAVGEVAVLHQMVDRLIDAAIDASQKDSWLPSVLKKKIDEISTLEAKICIAFGIEPRA